MFEIFSVGDSAYLQAVLNAVAMISATGDYRTAAGVGGLIGVIIISIGFWYFKSKVSFSCGTISGLSCPDGYSCKMDNNVPDAGGICIKNK